MNNGYTRNFIQNIIHSSLTKYFTEYNYIKEVLEPLKLCHTLEMRHLKFRVLLTHVFINLSQDF